MLILKTPKLQIFSNQMEAQYIMIFNQLWERISMKYIRVIPELISVALFLLLMMFLFFQALFQLAI